MIKERLKNKSWSPNRYRLTASGCALPRCHVIAICIQDWLMSGRVAMIVSIVTASLSLGGGCLMVQGVFGIQAHQSNWMSINKSRPLMWITCASLVIQHCWHQSQLSDCNGVWVLSTCPLLVAACWTVPVKMATDRRVQSSFLLLSFQGKPEHTNSTKY